MIYSKNGNFSKEYTTSNINFSILFFIFVSGSFIGCIIETVYALIFAGKFEYRVGLVYGPFIPIYGLGAMTLTVTLYKFFHSNYIALFIAGMIIGGLFEYFCSYFQEHVFGTISWDYSESFLNIHGRTNFAYSLIWGFLSILWIKEIYPFIVKQIKKIPSNISKVLTVFLLFFFLINIFLSYSAVIRRTERDEGIPATSSLENYLDEIFPDERLALIFPNMKSV